MHRPAALRLPASQRPLARFARALCVGRSAPFAGASRGRARTGATKTARRQAPDPALLRTAPLRRPLRGSRAPGRSPRGVEAVRRVLPPRCAHHDGPG
ncbi:MAG: hypothetical protein MZV64_10240 [Ignavibacteriales bacterium]|nr:hypothetical protein [Ignavibacteriales bacterium]